MCGWPCNRWKGDCSDVHLVWGLNVNHTSVFLFFSGYFAIFFCCTMTGSRGISSCRQHDLQDAPSFFPFLLEFPEVQGSEGESWRLPSSHFSSWTGLWSFSSYHLSGNAHTASSLTLRHNLGSVQQDHCVQALCCVSRLKKCILNCDHFLYQCTNQQQFLHWHHIWHGIHLCCDNFQLLAAKKN